VLINACKTGGGIALLRFSARRTTPAQAVALKKYRGAIGPSSSIEDSEQAFAPLRQSELLRVKHGPFEKSVSAQCHAFCSPSVVGDSEVASCQRSSHQSKIPSGMDG